MRRMPLTPVRNAGGEAAATNHFAIRFARKVTGD
jgi:hypothetical protein